MCGEVGACIQARTCLLLQLFCYTKSSPRNRPRLINPPNEKRVFDDAVPCSSHRRTHRCMYVSSLHADFIERRVVCLCGRQIMRDDERMCDEQAARTLGVWNCCRRHVYCCSGLEGQGSRAKGDQGGGMREGHVMHSQPTYS